MKKILITGGSGFVGGHLIKLAQKQYEVHATYNSNKIENQNVQSHFVNMVLPDKASEIVNLVKPDIIIHVAALSSPDFCEKNKSMAYLVNTDFTAALLQSAEKIGARFIFTSTDMVFDGKKRFYREDDETYPTNYYGETKKMAEEKCASLWKNVVIARLSLVYGFGNTKHNTFFEKMVANIKQKKTIPLFVDQFRTPILVNNLAEALLELAENNFTGTIHLGGGQRISRWDFGLLMCKILGLPIDNLEKCSMFDIPGAASRPQDVSLKNDLAKGILKTKLLDCTEGLLKIKETMERGI